MGNRSRIAITLTTTALLGAGTYVHVLHLNFLGGAGILVPWVLALTGVFVVYRWWSLLPALAYPVVHVYTYNHSSYVPRWTSDPVDLGSPTANALVGIVVCLVVFAIPLLLRAVWETIRSWVQDDALTRSG